VITADLPLVGQMRPGSFIRFQKVTVEEAQQALREYADKINVFKICMLNLPG
jgi:allophanate hydrolase subunit 2